MARRTYTQDQREEAVALYLQHGAAEAGRQTGIPAGTIAAWASRNDVASVRHEQLIDRTEANRVQWAERRTALAHDIGTAAARALQRCQEALDAGTRARDAQTYATTMAILADKAQLLTGGATSRAEHATATSVSEKLAEVVPITHRAA